MATVQGKSVIGLNVITVDTGTIVETVDDVAYNPTNHRVEALLVSSGGLFSSAKAIHMDDVHNIGEDAVIIKDASVLKSVKDIGDTVRSISDSNKHLVKTNVLSVDGKDLGKVTDMFFDSATGYAEYMEVSQGGLKTFSEGKKSIRPSDIVTIGADATIVSNYTEQKLEDQGEKGGVKGAVNEAKAKAEEMAASAKQSAQEMAENAKTNAERIANHARDGAERIADDAKMNARDMADNIKRRSDEAGAAISETAERQAKTAKRIANQAKKEAVNAKENIETTTINSSVPDNHTSDKVVEQTTKKLTSKDGSVTVQKTNVKKR